jgi:hypothetical protein
MWYRSQGLGGEQIVDSMRMGCAATEEAYKLVETEDTRS